MLGSSTLPNDTRNEALERFDSATQKSVIELRFRAADCKTDEEFSVTGSTVPVLKICGVEGDSDPLSLINSSSRCNSLTRYHDGGKHKRSRRIS